MIRILYLTALVPLCLNATLLFAQEKNKSTLSSIHAGLNNGILGGGSGPSFSFQYASGVKKIIQVESMLFFDSHSGKKFLSSDIQRNIGFGLVGGARINVFPKKNWNPSLVFMPGVIYSSEKKSSNDENRSGVSGAICFAFSNTFYKKHVISFGLRGGSYIKSSFLDYGFCF